MRPSVLLEVGRATLIAILLLFAAPLIQVADAATFEPTSTADVIDAAPGDGVCATVHGTCTLRAAVMEANALPGPDTIRLRSQTNYYLTIPGTGENAALTGDLDLTGELTIECIGSSTWVAANGIDRIFHVQSGAKVRMSNFNIGGGTTGAGGAMGNGGGIFNSGELVLQTMQITSSRAYGTAESGFGYGGAIGNGTGAKLTMFDTRLLNNQAEQFGGGIYQNGDGAVLDINGSSIASNTADIGGGGIYSGTSGTQVIKLTDSNVGGNQASRGPGGGIYASTGATLIMKGGTVASNKSLSGTTFAGQGGGIATRGNMSLDNVTVIFNQATSFGGGIEIFSGVNSITNSTIQSNKSTDASGAGISNAANATLTVSNTFIWQNVAKAAGGGIFNNPGSTLSVTNSTFSENASSTGGGGLYSGGDNATVTIESSTFTGNSTAGLGGALRFFGTDSTLHLRRTILANSTGGGDCQGTVHSQGYNLVEDAAGCVLTGDLTGNLLGQDPMLVGPGLNGGPNVTYALQTGSPAFNAGGLTGCPPTDQRGVSRPQFAVCDIGAFESETPPQTITPTPTATGTPTATSTRTATPTATSTAVHPVRVGGLSVRAARTGTPMPASQNSRGTTGTTSMAQADDLTSDDEEAVLPTSTAGRTATPTLTPTATPTRTLASTHSPAATAQSR